MGGTTVIITGTEFHPSATVAFGGVTASAITYVSSTELQVVTPAHAAGTVDILVTQSPHNQSVTLGGGFTYTTNSLSISSLSPTSGPAAGGTAVTILGSGFEGGAGVTFGGIAATSVSFISSNELQAVTPSSTAGTVSIVVTNPDSQSATLADAFTYTNALTVTGLSPTAGPTTGGTTVVIAGTGFEVGATVAFGSVASGSVTVNSSTQINAVSPPESSGTVAITVTNPDSQSATLAIAFTYTDSLTITGVSPAQGPVNGGVVVTITGIGFRSSASVAFGGVLAAAVTYISSTELQATAPAHAAGSVDVVVNQSPHNQSVTLTGGFTYIDFLTLSGISPAEGPVSGGTVVTLTGTGFQTGVTVKFGSVQSTAVTVVSTVQINAMLPPENTGTVDVSVTNPDGQSASLSLAFAYTTAPLVYSIWPNNGPVTGGTSVSILGGGFENGAGVTFGGTAATSVSFISSNELQVVTPASTAGTVSIVVTNPDSQTGTLEAGFAFLHTVDLSWTASTSDVRGYNVYRSSTSGGPYTRLNVTVISGTTFTDNNVQPGETIFYVASAVSTDNVEGDYSDEAQATVPSP